MTAAQTSRVGVGGCLAECVYTAWMAGKRQMILPRVTIFGVWLAVGAVVNLGVAWSLAAFLPQEGWNQRLIFLPTPESSDISRVSVWEYATPGAMRRTWEQHDNFVGTRIPPFSLAIRDARMDQDMTTVRQAQLGGIAWGNTPAVAKYPDRFSIDGCEHATGWPLLAAWYEIYVEDASWIYRVRGGMRLTGPASFTDICTIRGLPCMPIWPGFALNTIFYAALAWGAWQVPLAIRRRRRRARGQCVRCGHALAGLPAGSPCPECGTSFADR